MPIIEEAESYVINQLKDNDASHDWDHVQRVRKIAKHIGQHEKGVDMEIVDLAALFHEIGDEKYAKDGEDAATLISTFLRSVSYPQERAQTVVKVATSVSFRHQIRGSENVSKEVSVVRDADRLDAMGAIGIARAFTFGGARHRRLYDPKSDAGASPKMADPTTYGKETSTTVHHFYEKLLHLKGMMETKRGAEIATDRHNFMLHYLDRLDSEWEGEM